MMPQEAKKNELKKLFYTNLSSNELRNLLNITQKEYNSLLAQVKKELGLEQTYKRMPSKMNKYGENKYYIGHNINDKEFEIISYAPTREIAEDMLSYYNDDSYWIGQATEEHMLELIEEAYYTKEQSWNDIMLKYKFGYHTF